MSDIKKLIEQIVNFIDERDWGNFQTPKDLAISITLEAAELLEHFQWRSPEEIEVYAKKNKEEIGDELADVFVYLLELSHILQIDLIEAAKQKIKKNAKKYPVEKSRGRHIKYTKL